MPIIQSLRGPVALLAAMLAIVSLPTTSAHAADAAAQVGEQHLVDFVHYSLVANTELAKANADWLLDHYGTDEALATMFTTSSVTPERFDRAVQWASRVPGLSETVSTLANRIERGNLALSRDQARVTEAIAMLDGTRRDQMLARGRLVAAGEYAVPALLREMFLKVKRYKGLQLYPEILCSLQLHHHQLHHQLRLLHHQLSLNILFDLILLNFLH